METLLTLILVVLIYIAVQMRSVAKNSKEQMAARAAEKFQWELNKSAFDEATKR